MLKACFCLNFFAGALLCSIGLPCGLVNLAAALVFFGLMIGSELLKDRREHADREALADEFEARFMREIAAIRSRH